MATMAGLVQDVRNMLYGRLPDARPAEDTLATDVTDASDVSWRFDTEALWKRGTYAEVVDSDYEVVILDQDHPSGADVTVRRAQLGTTAPGGYSTGQVVLRNPIWPRVEIERYITEVLEDDFDDTIWTPVARTLTFETGDRLYDLAATDFDVADMYQADIDGDGRLKPLETHWWEVMPDVHTDVASTGRLLRVRKVHNEAYTVHYIAKLETTVANIASIADEIARMVPYMAAAKALLGGPAITAGYDPQRSERVDGIRIEHARIRRELVGEFVRMQDNYRRQLTKRYPPRRRWHPRRGRRAW